MKTSRLYAKPWDPRVVDARVSFAQKDMSKDAYGYSKEALAYLERAHQLADRMPAVPPTY
jgi:hypothetical protein